MLGQEGSRNGRMGIEVGHPGGGHRHMVMVGGEGRLAHVQGGSDGGHGATLSTVRVAATEAEQLLNGKRGALRQRL